MQVVAANDDRRQVKFDDGREVWLHKDNLAPIGWFFYYFLSRFSLTGRNRSSAQVLLVQRL